MLAVRNDAGTALAGTTLDYIPLTTDANGNLRVSGSFAVGREDETQHYNSATLVKDTINTVVTVSPGTTQNFIGALVSGAGYCEWQVEFGTTASEAIELVKAKPKTSIVANTMIPGVVIEGIVAKSCPMVLFRDGTPVMFKIKVSDYDKLRRAL